VRDTAFSRDVADAIGRFADWSQRPEIAEGSKRPEACDFLFGNPHDVAPQAYVDAIVKGAQPSGPDHYAYKMSEPETAAVVAAGLRARFGLVFADDDVMMTNGAFSGLGALIRILAGPGDEVIFVSPPWFFYETLIVAAGATPVRVLADRTAFDLDLEAIAAAITPRTRAIIVNSPNNPSGRIYPRSQLDELGRVLTEASDRLGEPIALLSDEAYNRIVFDDREFPTPLGSYAHSFLIYTYAKTHLAPGMRVGYVAMHPDLPEKDACRDRLLWALLTDGWGFPVAPLQAAIEDLEAFVVDVPTLQHRRDVLVSTLREQGYEVVEPEGTFYVLVRSPEADDEAFCERLRAHDVYVLPGAIFEMPGWFRISVTANDGMVARSLAGFGAAFAEARA
jgi:aspartate aminotransferase